MIKSVGGFVGLSSILAISADAQNRYGAERDVGHDVYNLKRDLEKTNVRVSKLEQELASLRSAKSQTGGHVSYDGGGKSSQAPTSSRSADGRYHRVQPGDTLSGIARRHQVGVDRLIAENRITNPNALRVGQEIFIPGRKGSAATDPFQTPPSPAPRGPAPRDPAPSGGTGLHTVQPGDTLYSIGRRYGVSSDSIIRANSMRNPNALRVGQRLSIPGASGAAPAPRQESRPAPPKPDPPRGGSEEVVAPEGFGFYQVEPGDTMHSIAISFGTNAAEVRRLNELRDSSLHVGDFLLVPVPDESLYEG